VPFRHSVKLVPECLMSTVLKRTTAKLASSPNYLELTSLIALAVVTPILFKPLFWSFSPRMCVAVASVAVVVLYACLGKGQIFTYLGWVAPRRNIYWLYAVIGGAAGAAAALLLLRGTGMSVGSAPGGELLYGASLGPIIEEITFRGAAFSVIYVTACSSKLLLRWRIGLAVVVTSLLFVWCHTRSIGIPWIVIFSMGIAYALLRWRSNSTATTALMHATYNGVIAVAMIHAAAV
jgi:membrane protease YdiL (CAAX protease family)